MKKRLLVLTAMMLCIVMTLSSCALFTPTVRFKNFVQKDTESEITPTLTTVNKLDLKGVVNTDSVGLIYTEDLVLLVDTNKSNGLKTNTVYNLATNKTICERTDSLNQSGNSTIKIEHSITMETLHVDGEAVTMVIIEKKTTTTTGKETDVVYDVTVLTEKGEEVVTFEDVNKTALEESIWSAADLFSIQYKVYRVREDGSASFAFNWSDLRQEPSVLLEKAGDYYVDYDLEKEAVFVYDSDLEMTATYVAPTYGGEDYIEDLGEVIFNANVLSNGNVLIQYIVRQDIMAQRYTFLMLGQKYNLYSVLLQAKNGKARKLNLNYLIEWVEYGIDAEYRGVSEKVENIAIGYAIEDQRINHNATAAKVLSLTNGGFISGVLDAPVLGATLEGGFCMVAKNRWEFSTIDGRVFMVDEEGVVLGENFHVDDSNADLFVSNKRLYDWDLNLKADLQQDATELIFVMDHGVLYETQKGEWKLYYNGTTQTIINESQAKEGKRTFQFLDRGAFMIVDETKTDPKYEIYNSMGALLGTITDNVSIPKRKIAENGAILLWAKAKDSSAVYYYRIG